MVKTRVATTPPIMNDLAPEPLAGGSVGNAKAIGGRVVVGPPVPAPASLSGEGVVGAGLFVGAVGTKVGRAEGTPVGKCVGSIDGMVVGDEVAPAKQLSAPELTQRGEKLSNCCKVSNTDANSQSSPVLLVSKLSLLEKELPKTTTSETPIALFRKHVRSKVNGPRVSTMKLFVSDY